MKKIKVLQFPIANARGGITQYALQNWKLIDKNRFQFDFATRSKTLDFAEELIEEGCKIHYLSCSAEENEALFIREMNSILDEDYDVLHLHTSFWKGYLVEKLAVERNCPKIIIHSHSTMIDTLDDTERKELLSKHQFYRDSLPLEYGTDFCACSKDAATWLFGNQIPKNRIHILKNAIDVEKYSYSPEVRKATRKKLGLDGCFVLGHVGRFSYQKNHKGLIDIFREVYRLMPNARLMLVGGGILEDSIRQQVEEYGLEKAVLFLGKRTDVHELFQAMDIFLFPSHFEGLGLVLIEAQAAGLPCITSESVPKEAKITPLLHFIPDSLSQWVNCILQTAKGYERKKQDALVTMAGYNLKNQIKTIEKMYIGEDISSYCNDASD